jgi:hypothetical protein
MYRYYEKIRPKFNREYGCFQAIRLKKYSYKWDFILAIETCRDLNNYDEWVCAVFYKNCWYEIFRTDIYPEAENKHFYYYDQLYDHRKNIEVYLKRELHF